MNRFLTALGGALALVLVTGSAVHADPVIDTTVQWTYSFTPSISSVASTTNPNATLLFINHTTSNSSTGLGVKTGPSDIVATNLQVSAPNDGVTYTLPSTNFTLGLQLTTLAPGANPSTANLTFGLTAGGTFGYGGANTLWSFAADPYSGPLPAGVQLATPSSPFVSEQKVSLGGDVYDITAYAVNPPGPAGDNGTNGPYGSIVFHVTPEIPGNNGGAASQLPEPSSILLSCLGGLSFAGAAWRKRFARARA